MESTATARFIRISPRKARLVADMVKGKRVEEALNLLSLCPNKPARLLAKTVRTAVANATSLQNVDVDTLYIKSITVDGGPILKRWRPRAMGRATRIRKRTSHVNVILDET